MTCSFSYDENNLLTGHEDFLGSVYTIGYHPTTADLNKITDSLNNDTVYVRDLNGNIITTVRYEGDVDTGTLKEEMDITVDQNGIPIVQSNDVTGRSSSRTVGENGAVDSQTSELGCTTSVAYTDITSTIMPMKFSLVGPSVVDGSIFLPIIPAPTFPIIPYDPLPATSTNAKKQIFRYAYTDSSTQPPTTKAWEMMYYDDGRVAGHTYSLNNVYQYDWEYYYSPYGIEKALIKYYEQLLITIDATTAPNGRMLSMYYQDNTCQTNCFQGEASAAYDPCGNMISLVSHTTGVEVWAKAIDKNSTQAIGIYNPYAIEMPFVGDGAVIPPYEEPIVSPIAFTIGGSGFNVKDHLASNTDLTIAIGENGAHAYIGGDDDCGESLCGEGDEESSDECDMLLSDWIIIVLVAFI